MPLREQIEAIAARPGNEFSTEDRAVFEDLKRALNRGEVRAAEKTASGKWLVNTWVKQGILLGFRMGAISDMSVGESFKFFDKDTYPTRPTKIEDKVSHEGTKEFSSLSGGPSSSIIVKNDFSET